MKKSTEELMRKHAEQMNHQRRSEVERNEFVQQRESMEKSLVKKIADLVQTQLASEAKSINQNYEEALKSLFKIF